MEDREFIHY